MPRVQTPAVAATRAQTAPARSRDILARSKVAPELRKFLTVFDTSGKPLNEAPMMSSAEVKKLVKLGIVQENPAAFFTKVMLPPKSGVNFLTGPEGTVQLAFEMGKAGVGAAGQKQMLEYAKQIDETLNEAVFETLGGAFNEEEATRQAKVIKHARPSVEKLTSLAFGEGKAGNTKELAKNLALMKDADALTGVLVKFGNLDVSAISEADGERIAAALIKYVEAMIPRDFN